MDKPSHDGHRNRMRARIRANGLDSLAPHEVLEYLLFAFVPRRNTNEIAHRLLEQFGSLSGVMDADYNQLVRVQGVTPNAALFLTQMPRFCMMYKLSKSVDKKMPMTAENAASYVNDMIGMNPTETTIALAIDVKGNLIKSIPFPSSDSDESRFDLRFLVHELLRLHAVGVIMAHNHPSGQVEPSREDVQTYLMLCNALAPLSINVVDCIIVGGGKAYSMRHSPPQSDMAERVEAKFAEARVPLDDPIGGEIGAGEPMDMADELLFNRNNPK